MTAKEMTRAFGWRVYGLGVLALSMVCLAWGDFDLGQPVPWTFPTYRIGLPRGYVHVHRGRYARVASDRGLGCRSAHRLLCADRGGPDEWRGGVAPMASSVPTAAAPSSLRSPPAR